MPQRILSKLPPNTPDLGDISLTDTITPDEFSRRIQTLNLEHDHFTIHVTYQDHPRHFFVTREGDGKAFVLYRLNSITREWIVADEPRSYQLALLGIERWKADSSAPAG